MNVFHLRFSLVASVKVAMELLMQTCWWPLTDHWSVQPTSPHLSGFVFYGCLESLTELSALWYYGHYETLSRMIADSFVFPILTTTTSALSQRSWPPVWVRWGCITDRQLIHWHQNWKLGEIYIEQTTFIFTWVYLFSICVLLCSSKEA